MTDTITLTPELLARREAIRDTVYVWVLANNPAVIHDAMLLVDSEGLDDPFAA